MILTAPSFGGTQNETLNVSVPDPFPPRGKIEGKCLTTRDYAEG